MQQVKGVAAASRLHASYDAIPAGPLVRLAKRTSNLFRARSSPRPVRLCPLRASRESSYPLKPGAATSTSGSGAACPPFPGAAEGDKNRAIEAKVTELGGHESLYCDAYYDRETFERHNGVEHLTLVEQHNRLTGLYEKAVQRR